MDDGVDEAVEEVEEPPLVLVGAIVVERDVLREVPRRRPAGGRAMTRRARVGVAPLDVVVVIDGPPSAGPPRVILFASHGLTVVGFLFETLSSSTLSVFLSSRTIFHVSSLDLWMEILSDLNLI